MVEKKETEVHVSLTQSASNPDEKIIEILSFTNKLTRFCNYLALFYAKEDMGR